MLKMDSTTKDNVSEDMYKNKDNPRILKIRY